MESTATLELQSLHSDTPIVQTRDLEGKSINPLHRLDGWRSGALGFALCSTVVFVFNLILTIWSSATQPENRGLLYQGNCDYAKELDTGLHVLINVLSTVLLSGSNYCMQCLSAPTRHEVDEAHAANKWLDIGIPSLRNLKHVSRQNLVLWLLLALTSLPLHLFYNSVVYVSISSNSYFAFSVSESFVDHAECLHCSIRPNNNTNIMDDYSFGYYPNRDFPYLLDSLWSRARNGTLDRLEPVDCIDQYATLIQPYRRNVLLVAADDHFPGPDKNTFINNSHVYDAVAFASVDARGPQQAADAYQWMCSGLVPNDEQCTNRISDVKASASAWRVGSSKCTTIEHHTRNSTLWDIECSPDHITYPVSYCLSEKAPAHCKVHFSQDISILVTMINLAKAALMFYAAFYVTGKPLMTVGDAIASFIEQPDAVTRNLCLLSITDIKNGYIRPGGRDWTHPESSWRHATSKTRRTVAVLMLAIALATVSALLWLGIYKLPEGQSTTFSGLASLGFGAVDPRTMITSNFRISDLVSNSIVANIPQLILSILYFSYNSIFTAMLLGKEWTSFAQKRKGLRVSRPPIGDQRSSYFLQLPYRFSIPLMIISGTLHWLVSQSIFLVSIDLYDYMDNQSAVGQYWLRVIADYSDDIPLRITTCGYSPIAIISVLILGSLMLLALIGVGYIPYRRTMPLAGSCSMAISAACHPEKTDRDQLSTRRLQWGAVLTADDEGVGHCAFSALPVEPPVGGQMYA